MPSIASIRFDVALDLVLPGRRVRVLEVGHEALGARVERVDDQLAVGRAGDLDAAVLRSRRAAAGPTTSASSRISRVSSRKPDGAPRSARACSSSLAASRRTGRGDRRRRRARRRRGSRRGGRRWSGRCPASRSAPSDRVVQQRHGVVDRHRALRVRGDLDRTARVGGGDRLGAGGGEVRGLAPRRAWRRLRAARGCRCPPSRSTAPTRPARPARAPGSRAAARAAAARTCLGVGEVAGVVVGDLQRQRIALGARLARRPAARGRRSTLAENASARSSPSNR